MVDKQSHLQYLDAGAGRTHTAPAGASVWDWAGTERPDRGRQPDEPDIVLAAAGDVPTQETLAAAAAAAPRTCPTCGCAWSTWST